MAVWRPVVMARITAVTETAVSSPMIKITTIISTSVKPLRGVNGDLGVEG